MLGNLFMREEAQAGVAKHFSAELVKIFCLFPWFLIGAHVWDIADVALLALLSAAQAEDFGVHGNWEVPPLGCVMGPSPQFASATYCVAKIFVCGISHNLGERFPAAIAA
jgi:hypothetical protein